MYNAKPMASGIPIHVGRLLDPQMAIANRIVPAARKRSPGMKNTTPSPKRTEFMREVGPDSSL